MIQTRYILPENVNTGLCKWTDIEPTEIDWQCYLNRYPDLREMFGTDLVAAENHYNTIGIKYNAGRKP